MCLFPYEFMEAMGDSDLNKPPDQRADILRTPLENAVTDILNEISAVEADAWHRLLMALWSFELALADMDERSYCLLTKCSMCLARPAGLGTPSGGGMRRCQPCQFI